MVLICATTTKRRQNQRSHIIKKHVFSGLCIYELVLSEPANSQNDENKWFLHLSPTDNMELLQAGQILLLSLRN